MQHLVILMAVFIQTSWADSGSFQTKVLTFKADPSSFVEGVARYCMSSSSAKLEPSGKVVRITDRPACIEEIQGMAAKWELHPELEIAAVHTTKRMSPQELHKKLKQKADQKSLMETGMLGWGKACPCLAFMGTDAKKVGELGNEILSEKK